MWKINKRLLIVINFFWIVLIEKAFSVGALFQLGSSFDVTISTLFRIYFIFNLVHYIVLGNKIKSLKPVVFLTVTIFVSNIVGGFIAPEYFINSISITIQVLSVLSIITYIFLSKSTIINLQAFTLQLRFFGLFNALMVIISFISPSFLIAFESAENYSGINRSFGIMGDEVALFITYFIIDALHFRKWTLFTINLIALFLTGTIGATVTFFACIVIYLFLSKKFRLASLPRTILLMTFFSLFILYNATFFSKLAVVRRIQNNIVNTDDNSANLRLISMQTGVNVFRDFPLLGTGFGFYQYHVTLDYLGDQNEVIISNTFNQYLQILCEMGVVGLLIYFHFIYKIIQRLKRYKDLPRDTFAYGSGMIAYTWLIALFLTFLSGVWVLPSSFIFFLIVSLIGIHLSSIDKLLSV
jgi:O-antigen ligase